MKERLRVSLDSSVVERARRYAGTHGTSISRLVESFLNHLPVDDEVDASRFTPAVQRLLGIASESGGVDDYHAYIVEKYGR
jgi:hypothetical protein